MFSLRKTLYGTTLTAAVILCVVLMMGVRQYSLAGRYDSIIDQSEKLIFQFATIRDHVTESLLAGRYQQLGPIVEEIESLNTALSGLLENSLIPGEYKLTFINQVDLSGIVLLLRKIEAETDKQSLANELNVKMRLLGDRLMRFDRIIVGQAKATLVRFQNVVIGGLAIVLCIFSFLLVLWYRKLAVPIIGIARQIQKDDSGKAPLQYDSQAFDELSLLASTHSQLQEQWLDSSEKAVTYQAQAELLFSSTDDALFLVDAQGEVLKANEAAARFLGRDLDVIHGFSVVSLFFNDIGSNQASQLVKALQADESSSFHVLPDGFGKRIRFKISFPECGAPSLCLVVAQKGDDQNAGLSDLTIRVCGLAAIGELCSGVVHEVSNLINGIINYGQVLLDEFGQQEKDSAKVGLLSNMVRDGERAATVLHQVQYLAREQGKAKDSVPMATVVGEALSLVDQLLKNDGIILDVAFPIELPAVHVNKEHMHLVFLNVFMNARHALNERFPARDEQKKLEVHGEVVYSEGRNWLRSSVTDWGVGVEPEVLSSLMEPFFSTKGKDGGTGLGLTISKFLVEENGGKLSVDSVAGNHTTVLLDLPVVAGS